MKIENDGCVIKRLDTVHVLLSVSAGGSWRCGLCPRRLTRFQVAVVRQGLLVSSQAHSFFLRIVCQVPQFLGRRLTTNTHWSSQTNPGRQGRKGGEVRWTDRLLDKRRAQMDDGIQLCFADVMVQFLQSQCRQGPGLIAAAAGVARRSRAGRGAQFVQGVANRKCFRPFCVCVFTVGLVLSPLCPAVFVAERFLHVCPLSF
jgi:hypothetical protein